METQLKPQKGLCVHLLKLWVKELGTNTWRTRVRLDVLSKALWVEGTTKRLAGFQKISPLMWFELSRCPERLSISTCDVALSLSLQMKVNNFMRFPQGNTWSWGAEETSVHTAQQVLGAYCLEQAILTSRFVELSSFPFSSHAAISKETWWHTPPQPAGLPYSA